MASIILGGWINSCLHTLVDLEEVIRKMQENNYVTEKEEKILEYEAAFIEGDMEKANSIMAEIEADEADSNGTEIIDVEQDGIVALSKPDTSKFVAPAITSQFLTVKDTFWKDSHQIFCGKNKKVVFALSNENKDDIKTHKEQAGFHFNAFDIAVLNAIVTITDMGFCSFTIPQIYRIVTGAEDSSNRTYNKDGRYSELYADIFDSIEKMRHIIVYYTDEVPQNMKLNFQTDDVTNIKKLNRQDVIVMDSALIDANSSVFFKYENGKVIRGYILRSLPIIYRFAKKRNEFILIPIKLLQVPFERISKRIIVLRNCILNKVESLKNPYNEIYQTSIRCSTLYQELGDDYWKEKTRNENNFAVTRKKIRDIIEKLFRNWIQMGYIKGFNPVREGRSITKYEIFLNEDDQRIVDEKIKRKQARYIAKSCKNVGKTLLKKG